jgi:aminopeptidase
VRDQRAVSLAQVLVGYSTEVGEGDVCMIHADAAAEPLVHAIYEEILRAGGLPMVAFVFEEHEATLLSIGSDDQLDWVAPSMSWAIENADVHFHVGASTNLQVLSEVDPARQARRQAAFLPMMQAMMSRSSTEELRFCTTLFPTEAYAAAAGMSLASYEDLYYRACLCADGDALAAWRQQSDQVQRVAEWLSGKEEVRIEGPDVDLSFNVGERTFIAGTGIKNMPDGEVFTGPVEDSANGRVRFSYPGSFAGREIGGVELRFEDGRVVDASAETGEEYLLEMLDTDEGARKLGEFGIGTHYGISRFTGEALLDEKIGGTFHLALGMSYPETGGRNFSSIHWDMVCDLRDGGRIEVDGDEFLRDGKLLVG